MGKASRTKQEPDRRARIAAQREAQRRAEQRRRIYLAGGSILVVVIVVVAFVLVKLNSGGGTAAPSSDGPTGTALTAVVNDVTNVPTSVTDKVGAGGVPAGMFVDGSTASSMQTAANLGSYFATVNGTPLTENGKPEVLFIGSEYCPYCAAQRWAMVNAFSRFGTFTGLTTTHSSSSDSYPNTPTVTFYGSTYKSNYISFTSVEEQHNYRIGNSSSSSVAYAPLQTPTAAEQALQVKYDPGPTSEPGQSIPFIDFGNKYVQVGNLSPLDPPLLAGLSWATVATDMNKPSSSVGTAEIGNANYETAAICELTGNKPATACTPTIQKLETTLAK
jgi:hypothetical protein